MNPDSRVPSRRDFLRSTTALAAGTAVAANLGLLANAHASGSDVIRVGLIGCGARGRGAVDNCLQAAPGVKLVALGDTFPDRLEGCRKKLKDHGDKAAVKDDHCFIGLDAHEKVLASGVDYVILTTPPGFRPLHIQAAVAAGKHIFAEKPLAVDAVGVRRVMGCIDESRSKGLGFVIGTQRRHQDSYLEAMKRLHDGDIGEILAARCYWNQGHLGVRERKPAWNDLEYQIRNWLYFTWMSGDHICEQHMHNIDVVNWAMGTHPVRAVGMGGRQVRIEPKFGHIFDHFTVDFEYANGVHLMSMCRQIDGCEQNCSEVVVGTKGTCTTDDGRRSYSIKGEKPWHFPRDKNNLPYVQEHADLIESIRAGKPINEMRRAAESTLTAVMGRMSAYSGKAVTWEQAMTSKEDLMPAKLDWAMSLPTPPIAMPGKTQLS